VEKGNQNIFQKGGSKKDSREKRTGGCPSLLKEDKLSVPLKKKGRG